MKKCSLPLVGALLITLLSAGCGTTQTPPQQTAQPVELTVSAAASMKDVLEEIQKDYQAQHPNVKITYNMGASGALQQQIEQGAPVDIFISAATKQMDQLEAENLIDNASRKNLVENRLVLIVPQNSTLGLSKFEDLTKPSVTRVGIGETKTVPAGQYAMEVLKNMGIWDSVQGKMVMAQDVRNVLAYVETGNVDAGIVYKTDAAISNKVKIAAEAPAGSHKPIVYPAAIVKASKQQKAAQDFETYLLSPECKAIFEKYGFAPGQ